MKKRETGSVMAIALAVAIALAGLTGGNAWAEESSCQEEWESSQAKTYCSNTTILQVGQSVDIECDITTSCSFNVTYGPGGSSSVTVTPSLSLSVIKFNNVAFLTICVTESTDSNGDAVYSARVSSVCDRTNEYSFIQVERGQFHD